MKNIHVLPTDKPSRLFIDIDNNKLTITNNPIGGEYFMNQNIYITSDEEIKEGNYHISSDGWCIDKTSKEDLEVVNEKRNGYKKIILTDNKDLIKDGLQAIPDDFLEWFVKNPSCDEIKINKLLVGKDIPKINFTYKIIIPKQTDWKDSTKALMVAYGDNPKDFPYEEPKQETLEEAALIQDYTLGVEFCAFIEGAKWKQERSYSEEDMISFGEWMKILPLTISGFVVKTKTKSIVVGKTKELLKIWFEQFKKK